jgi:rhodanese-related sulfurtransferase
VALPRSPLLVAILTLSLAACSSDPPASAEDASADAPPESSTPDALDAADVLDAADASDAVDASDVAPATLGVMTVAELHAALSTNAKDFLLIDVHVPVTQKIAGTDAILPYTDVDAIAAYVGGNLDAKVVVYCQAEGMSVPTGNALVAKGYRAVRYLQGGMSAWQAAGYPLVPAP